MHTVETKRIGIKGIEMVVDSLIFHLDFLKIWKFPNLQTGIRFSFDYFISENSFQLVVHFYFYTFFLKFAFLLTNK